MVRNIHSWAELVYYCVDNIAQPTILFFQKVNPSQQYTYSFSSESSLKLGYSDASQIERRAKYIHKFEGFHDNASIKEQAEMLEKYKREKNKKLNSSAKMDIDEEIKTEEDKSYLAVP